MIDRRRTLHRQPAAGLARAWVLFVGLAITVALALTYLSVRVGYVGPAAIPFIVVAYMLGVIVAFAVRPVVGDVRCLAVALAIEALFAVVTINGGYWNMAFWFGAVPAAGAIAVAVPTREATTQ